VFRLLTRRVLVAIATILGASIFSFLLLRKLPGDPARLVAGDLADEQTVDALRQSMGLDGSILSQFWSYLTGLFRGDLGFSYSLGQPVQTLVGTRLTATVELGVTAVILAVGMAVIFGAVAVYRTRKGADRLLRASSSLAMGSPPFWVALVVLLLFSLKLGIFPGPEGRLSPDVAPPPTVTGLFTLDALLAGEWSTWANAVWHLVLPAFVIAIGPFAFLSRLFRNQLRNTVREPYVTVARSRGLTRGRAFRRHVIPYSLLSLLAAASLLFAELLTGSVLVEKVFGWPGVGSLTVDAILQKDFSVVQGVIVLSATLYVLISLAADLVYVAVDPRLRAA
jgi:peptide/nickel transport system permease protein